MRLHNYTLLYISVALFFIISVWAATFYFQMLDEVYDSIDDNLENYKLLIIQKAHKDSSILQKTSFDESNYAIRKITDLEIHKRKDVFKDTSMYMLNEDDLETVRLLKTVFTINHSDYYELRIISSMVEEDDLIEDLFYSLIWLYIILLISIFIVNTVLLKKIWKPFYGLLKQLESFSLHSSNFNTPQTNVHEFKLLNTAISDLLKKNIELYNSQKQFIENASHELQTPLAISINKLELLAEKNDLSESDLSMVASAIENLHRLTRLNKSLLLLSKIENKQFTDEAQISIAEICERLTTDFSDLASFKNISLKYVNQADVSVKMNKDLADVLLSNLIKNAIVHTPANGSVQIITEAHAVTIQNSGDTALDEKNIFMRFYKNSAEKNTTGLGLAIVKTIADKYKFKIFYSYQGMHKIKIGF
ncbi:sensor histidine kinase [Cytophaga hutchinsonii]|uniref:histidine kinase n=1 Tax=Cytophaga hutchinsonii (strain ATCC 33406 / DSM 1761 / CIP 103989 / NBRC 15051 / NCIMB 9469 / D465) TaxID=269798 RepID=A0A6N4SWC6_CYTH3|nr:HAMP domain-containing sensor histidine kinase [Cytophaga hutchinsonii]ABG60766.1 two-component sensor histidine kinase [Cytophaga hutchinsonii ATCC 33406]SFX71481.1 Signal transduction histidine kinase [Cytophaga hutchinsonii ATCC 33406]